MFVTEQPQVRSQAAKISFFSTVNSHMPLGKSPSLSEPQFPDTQNEGVGMDQ